MEVWGFAFFKQTNWALSFPDFLLGFGAAAVTQDMEGLLCLHREKDE